jgi:hypothetical protein
MLDETTLDFLENVLNVKIVPEVYPIVKAALEQV